MSLPVTTKTLMEHLKAVIACQGFNNGSSKIPKPSKGTVEKASECFHLLLKAFRFNPEAFFEMQHSRLKSYFPFLEGLINGKCSTAEEYAEYEDMILAFHYRCPLHEIDEDGATQCFSEEAMSSMFTCTKCMEAMCDKAQALPKAIKQLNKYVKDLHADVKEDDIFGLMKRIEWEVDLTQGLAEETENEDIERACRRSSKRARR